MSGDELNHTAVASVDRRNNADHEARMLLQVMRTAIRKSPIGSAEEKKLAERGAQLIHDELQKPKPAPEFLEAGMKMAAAVAPELKQITKGFFPK